MKLARLIGLVCVTAIAALALVGPSSAMAETTALCSVEENPCKESNQIKEIEFEADDIVVLTSAMDYECDASFSATVSGLGAPQTLTVTEMQYTSCNQGCSRTVEELGTFSVNRTGADLGYMTGIGFEVYVECESSIDCTYAYTGMSGTIQGGHITFVEAPFEKISGLLCPDEAYLDALFVASEPVYVMS
jgi:hypothetical protein